MNDRGRLEDNIGRYKVGRIGLRGGLRGGEIEGGLRGGEGICEVCIY